MTNPQEAALVAHHAEAFREGHEPHVRFGWQCLVCGAEAYTSTLHLAEVGASQHESQDPAVARG